MPPGCCYGRMYCWISYEECGFWSGTCECHVWGCGPDTGTDAPGDVIDDPDAADVPGDEHDASDIDVSDTTDPDDSLDMDGSEG